MFGETVRMESFRFELMVSLKREFKDQINSSDVPYEFAKIVKEPPPSHNTVSFGIFKRGVFTWTVWKAVSTHMPLEMYSE